MHSTSSWWLVGLSVVTTVFASPAAAEGIASCELSVAGETYISGPCDFDDIGSGDFVIRGGDYFAYIYVRETPANGFWNGVERSSHAHDPLGDLTRDGACWVNESARVCASK